ncbi:MAG: hypothetical protein ABI652_01980 [Acidobacteriota bacterium]
MHRRIRALLPGDLSSESMCDFVRESARIHAGITTFVFDSLWIAFYNCHSSSLFTAAHVSVDSQLSRSDASPEA